MRRLSLIPLATLVLIVGPTVPSMAEPQNARISLQVFPAGLSTAILGTELEARLGATPFRLGGQTGYITGGAHAQGTLWLRYELVLSPDLKVGGILGLNQPWDRLRTPAMDGAVQALELKSGPVGYVVGVAARREFGSFWAQANPNYVVIPGLNYLTSERLFDFPGHRATVPA